MGVKSNTVHTDSDIWLTVLRTSIQLLEPASVKISLRSHAIERGFVNNVRGDRTIWFGIDARCVAGIFLLKLNISSSTSHWIFAAKARHGRTQSLELTALHLRCDHLAQLSITPTFVFDGPNRPNVKHACFYTVLMPLRLIRTLGFCPMTLFLWHFYRVLTIR